jgi:hypothetical protein
MKVLHIYYRLSDKGEKKERLSFINNKVCLDNFLQEFPQEQITILADNVKDETIEWLETYNFKYIHRTNSGNSGSFWFAFTLALKLPPDDYVYFVENDYIHKPKSALVLTEGLGIADYVTLYDHPDKYSDGLNPNVHSGGEKSKVFLTKSSHWKKTNSTTMTFASKVSILQKDSFIFKLFTIGLFRNGLFPLNKFAERKFPADYRIFCFLTRFKHRLLISPIPGFSTHGEIKYLSPLIDWNCYINPEN